MRKVYLIGLLAVSVIISGCGMTNSATFRSMSAAYREVVESYSNDNILINIVRASQQMPISFLDIPSIQGQGTVSVGAGLGATVYGADPGSFAGFFQPWSGATGLANYMPNVSLSVNGGYSFTQSSLDNATFMKPFLSPIMPEIVGYLASNQAAPKSVLYSLVIDSIDIVKPNREIYSTFVNDPKRSDYSNFQSALYILVSAGLTVEPSMLKMPMSPEMDEATMRASLGMFTAALASGIVADEIPASPGRPKKYRLVRMIPEWRLCLNKVNAQSLFGNALSEEMYCKQAFQARAVSRSAQELTKMLADNEGSPASSPKNSTVNIKLRSTENVFSFLGEIISMQYAAEPKFVTIFDPQVLDFDPNAKASDFPSVPLFVVHKDKSVANPLNSLSYRGSTYTISDDRKSFTKDVMVLLSQMLTLNKIAGSIPPSPAVLVR